MKGVAALAVAMAAAVAVVAWQPVASPWWIYADADASYMASSVDAMVGEHLIYLDHPGMPLQDLMALTVEARYLAHRATGGHGSARDYAGQRLLHLDDSRIFFRGYAILFYLAGALLAFVVFRKLLGDPWWGTVGALAWLAAPGMRAMSIQYRPDGLLAGAVLAVGYLIVRAAQRRDAWTYTQAALLLGLALTLKIHAAALFAPFAVALLWRRPGPGWEQAWRADAGRWLRRYRVPLILFAVVWIAGCAIFDPHRIATGVPSHQLHGFAAIAAAFVVVVAAALVLRQRLLALLLAALAVGVVLPGTLVINDLPEMVVKIVQGLTGSGANSGVQPFSTPVRELFHQPLLPTTVLLVLSAVAAAVGARRRDFVPAMWFSGSALAYVMASARLGTVHYYAPAFVLALPPTLWLVAQLEPRLSYAAAAVGLALLLYSPIRQLPDQRRSARLQEQQWAQIEPIGDRLLTKPGTLAVVEDYTDPVPDVRWHVLVSQYAEWVPPYPYRYLDDSGASKTLADQLKLEPRYFVGGLPLDLHGPTREQLAFGSYVVRPLPVPAAARRLSVGWAALR